MGLLNMFTGARKRASNAARYTSGQVARIGARAQGYNSLAGRTRILRDKAAANKNRLQKSLTNMRPGESLNDYRARLAKDRLNTQAASRKELVNRIMGYEGEGKNRTTRIGRWAQRVLKYGKNVAQKIKYGVQNAIAGKMGRKDEERRANWAAYYDKQREGYEKYMPEAMEADANAEKINNARLAFMGLVWLGFSGAKENIKKFFISLATVTPPNIKQIWKDLEDAVNSTEESTEILLKNMATFISTGAAGIRNEIQEGLKSIRRPTGYSGDDTQFYASVMKALDAAYKSIVSSSSAAGDAIKEAGGAAIIKAGQIAKALEDIPDALKNKMCAQLKCPPYRNMTRSNNGAPAAAPAARRNRRNRRSTRRNQH